jgi:hypothetical protein
MCISHRLQCKIKVKINQVQIKILKIPKVDNFHLINSSKRYHVYNDTNIHLLDMKYGYCGSNTLTQSYQSCMKITKSEPVVFRAIYHSENLGRF